MKKTASLGALLLALALPLAAQAETVFAGEVTAETAQVIAAPYGGLVEDVRVRVGDSVKIGDPIATVETAKTYASTDGTVSGVFAHEGDSADGVKTQYGALVYIEPINRFTLACSTEKGYNSSENRYIHIGETVFLKCTKDGSHQGRGVVTGLDEKDDSKFTVEVTGGEFYMGETVDIYRSGDYANASRIGRGTVGRTQTVAVNAEGSVLKMHVKAGDTVKAGTVLGKEGNTGYSLGTHLHFDVNDGQGYVDPMPYLRGEKLFNKITNGNSTKDNGVKIGATCTVNKGAKFSDGTTPASFVYTTTFTVLNISNDNTEVLIGLNGAATGWIKVVDTSLAGSVPSTTTFKVGDKCRVKSGAKFSNGVTPDEWVFEYEFKILSLSKNGKEAKIGTTDGAATGWIYLSDLYKGKTTSAATVIRVGDRVKIKKNASWFGCSNKINDWRNEKIWIVEEVVKNRAVLGRDATGVFNIMSAIDVKYLIKQ